MRLTFYTDDPGLTDEGHLEAGERPADGEVPGPRVAQAHLSARTRARARRMNQRIILLATGDLSRRPFDRKLGRA
jgi:hypothetical protein